MRKNKFNLIIPFGKDNYLAYNPLTNALCKIDGKIVAFLEGKETSISSEVIQELVKGLFWVPNAFNEISYVNHLYYSLKYSSVNISFTIIPTLFCNLQCIYCYETTTNKNVGMDASITKKVIIFILQKIDEFHPASLHITWYGGEPLLEMDTIAKISQTIQTECSKRDIKYTAGLVTNGTLISECDRDFFSLCKITDAQVTIDGPSEIHNFRRPFKDGTGTYDIIMRNIFDILANKIDIRVKLRINIDKENEKYMLPFLKDLAASIKNWDRLTINFGQVISKAGSICKSRGDTLFTTSNFGQYYLKILKEMRRLNLPLPALYPSFNSCIWKKFSSWVIGPCGEIYACWEDVGDEDKAVGNIETGIDLKKNRTIEWIFSNWRATEGCLCCPIVPICLGGCPRRRETEPENRESGCIYWRYIFKQLLLLHAEKRKEN